MPLRGHRCSAVKQRSVQLKHSIIMHGRTCGMHNKAIDSMLWADNQSYYRPPRSARTRCSTDPAAILKSLAVLSSGLWNHVNQSCLTIRTNKRLYSHLPPSKNKPLLWWRDTRLLFNFLLDSCDLLISLFHRRCSIDERRIAHLILRIDVKFNLI